MPKGNVRPAQAQRKVPATHILRLEQECINAIWIPFVSAEVQRRFIRTVFCPPAAKCHLRSQTHVTGRRFGSPCPPLKSLMSALRQKQTFPSAIVMSALPPKADIGAAE